AFGGTVRDAEVKLFRRRGRVRLHHTARNPLALKDEVVAVSRDDELVGLKRYFRLLLPFDLDERETPHALEPGLLLLGRLVTRGSHKGAQCQRDSEELNHGAPPG